MWPMGLHKIRILFAAVSGMALLLIFLGRRYHRLSIQTIKLFVLFSFLVGTIFFHKESILSYILDLSSYGLVLSALILTKDEEMRMFIKLMACVSIVLILVLSIYYGFDVRDIASVDYNRENAFKYGEVGSNSSYYSYIAVMSFIPLMYPYLVFNSFYTDRASKYIIVVSLIIIFVFGIYYVKRQLLMEGIFFLVANVVTNTGRRISLISNARIIIIGLILLYLGQSLGLFRFGGLATLISRFDELASLRDFDRFEELGLVFRSFTLKDYLLGLGVGGQYTGGYGGGSTVHIGYANFILKGGIFLATFAFIGMITNTVQLYMLQLRNSYYVPFFMMSLYVTISFFVIPGFGVGTNTIVVSIGLFSLHLARKFKIYT